MKETESFGARPEETKGRNDETALKVLSFGRVEDMIDELTARPPDGNVVRIDTCVKDGRSNEVGLGLRTASVLITARRGDEVLIANLIHTYCQTLNGRAIREGDRDLAAENHQVVRRVLEEQFGERDFIIGRGAYIVPDYLTVYRSTSERILFKERQALVKDEATIASLSGSLGGADSLMNTEKRRLTDGEGEGSGI